MLPNGESFRLEINDNCPYADEKVFETLSNLEEEEYNEVVKSNVSMLGAVYRLNVLRIRTESELRRHRAAGHVPFSSDCPECRKSFGSVRPHFRMSNRDAGDLSIDIAGPFEEGLWPHTRIRVGAAPKYFLVGAFTTFSAIDAMDAYVTAEQHMRGAGIEGPVPLEQCVDEDKRTVYVVEILSSKLASETIPAIKRMIARLQRYHRCQCVYRLHSDRAPELCGKSVIDAMADCGVEVTSTVGYDPNGNGRAERGVRWIKDKARTYLAGLKPSECRLWPFAVVHSSEVQLRGVFAKVNVDQQFEFGELCLSLDRNPVDPWVPRYQKVQYLGLVPGITHGHFVRRSDGGIIISGNLKHSCDFEARA